MLPKVLQQIAPLWPSYHLDRIALAAVGLAQDAWWPHVLVLAGFAAVFFLLAARRLRRNG
jgi:ABC-2 type transport system permease protein